MEKINSFLENPFYRAILWLALGVIIFFVGITRPKADSLFNNNTLHFYNNNGSSYNDVGTSYTEQIDESWAILTTVSGSYGGLVAIQLSSPLIQGHIYTLYLNVGAESNGGQTRLSSKNCLGIGGSDSSANNSYLNCDVVPRFSDYSTSTQDKARGVYYTFIASNNGIILSVPYTSQYTCTGCRNYSYGYTIQDNGDSSVLTQSQINTIINNQTSSIQNQITQSQNVTNQTIIDSANNTDTTIVNNANSTNDVINNGLQTCTKQFKFTLKKGKAFNSNGTLSDNPDSYYTEKYYSLSGATKLTISNTGLSYPDYSGYIIIYDSSKNFLDYWSVKDVTFNLPSGSAYYRLSTEMIGVTLYEGDGCTSKLDAVNDTLTDDNVDGNSASDFFSDFTVTDNGGISSIITAPLVAINSMLSNQCSPLSGTWRGQTFELPCGTDFWNRMSTIRNWLNVAIGGLLCYRIIIKLFKLIEGFKNPDNDRVEVMNL